MKVNRLLLPLLLFMLLTPSRTALSQDINDCGEWVPCEDLYILTNDAILLDTCRAQNACHIEEAKVKDDFAIKQEIKIARKNTTIKLETITIIVLSVIILL